MWLLAGLAAAAGAQQQDSAAPVSEISAEQALAAFAQFREDPVGKLDRAPVFLEFIQTHGSVHIVLDSNIVFWMWGDHPGETKAVLYAAFMGGNMESQIRGTSFGDDRAAGMSAAIDAYETLKLKDRNVAIPEFEILREARSRGTLEDAVDQLSRGQPLR